MVDLISQVREKFGLFLLVTGTGILLGVVVALLIPATYRSHVVLLPNLETPDRGALSGLSGGLGSFADLAGISLGSNDNQEVAIAFLESRQVFLALDQKINLKAALYPRLWDSERQRWAVDPDEIPSDDDAYRKFDREVRRVSHDRRSGLVVLSVDWTDPAAAKQWANELVEATNSHFRRQAESESSRALELLGEEVARTSIVELRTAIFRLMEFEIKKALNASIRRDYAFKIIDPAFEPSKKNKIAPKRALIVIGAAFASVALFFMIMAIRSAEE